MREEPAIPSGGGCTDEGCTEEGGGRRSRTETSLVNYHIRPELGSPVMGKRQSVGRIVTISERFQSGFRAIIERLRSSFWSAFRAIPERFQQQIGPVSWYWSRFRAENPEAVSEQFRGSFRAMSGLHCVPKQFNSSLRAVSERYSGQILFYINTVAYQHYQSNSRAFTVQFQAIFTMLSVQLLRNLTAVWDQFLALKRSNWCCKIDNQRDEVVQQWCHIFQ